MQAKRPVVNSRAAPIGADCYSKVMHYYNLGHKIIQEALEADENNTPSTALYRKGLHEFQRALQVTLFDWKLQFPSILLYF